MHFSMNTANITERGDTNTFSLSTRNKKSKLLITRLSWNEEEEVKIRKEKER